MDIPVKLPQSFITSRTLLHFITVNVLSRCGYVTCPDPWISKVSGNPLPPFFSYSDSPKDPEVAQFVCNLGDYEVDRLVHPSDGIYVGIQNSYCFDLFCVTFEGLEVSGDKS